MSSPRARGFGAQDGAQGELRGVAAGAVLDEAGMRRALTRIAHEIVERHPPPEPLVLMGMQTRGVPLAERLAVSIEAIDGRRIPAGAIDNSLYRDDLARRSTARILPSRIPGDIDGSVIVLVDDVLFTGRSIRAALDALIDYGRPAAIELAVLVDRGHRELPIRADYVGKNLPTRRGDDVRVRLSEVDGVDEASLHPAPLELSGDLSGELSGEGGR